MEIRRKLYARGSSFETTIPRILLVENDLEKKNEVVFKYDSEKKQWYISIEEGTSNEKVRGRR